jgi:hypothetical protein
METMEMKNMVWSVYEGGIDGTDSEVLSNKVVDVFCVQNTEKGQPSAYDIPDGLYPFYNWYGLVGKIKIQNGLVDVQHLDKQIPKRFRYTNDHVWIETMRMNQYGFIVFFLGS